MTNLKDDIRSALAGSSSRQPVDTGNLARGHRRGRVEAALLEMYHAREVCCCKIIKGKQENVVWWLSGDMNPLGHTRMCADKRRTP